MNNSNFALKSLVIYALVLPLAILLGFMLGNPLSTSSLGTLGVVSLLLVFPLLMKWHYPLLLFTWNMSLSGLFFLPGSPNLWLVLVLLSFSMALLERALIRQTRFILVPQMIWPLLFLAIVLLVTAKLTGGFGLRSMGSNVYGGKKYIYVMGGILSYFVLTARRIPLEQANLFVGLFLLGGLTNIIGDFYPITPKAFQFIFWVFPPNSSVDQLEFGVTRLRGTSFAGLAACSWLMARYGVRGIFLSGKIWRILAFLFFFALAFLGGFRSVILALGLMFVFQFFLEGLHRSKLLPLFIVMGILGAAVVIPFASKLPFTFQRSLAFLPKDVVELDRAARINAEISSNWRIQMWEALLPQVSQHLLLGKGYVISQADYEMMERDTAFRAFSADQEGLALAGDYHNGPLSVIIPFGIWGAMAFCWFLGAGIWVVYRNYRYGDPDMKTINTFLLAVSLKHLVMFFFVFGALNSDTALFAGFFGLSVALNGGVAKRVVEPVVVEEKAGGTVLPLHRRPSFQR